MANTKTVLIAEICEAVCSLPPRVQCPTKRNFIKIQFLWNSKEYDCAQNIFRRFINVSRSMKIYFPELVRLTSKEFENVAHLTLGFVWPCNYYQGIFYLIIYRN